MVLTYSIYVLPYGVFEKEVNKRSSKMQKKKLGNDL
jgi:hypothetical protein